MTHRNQELEAVLDEQVRPLLRSHGGDLEVLSMEEGIVRFRLLGHCAGCAAADLTAQDLVQEELCKALPWVKQAVLVNQVSQELLDQAMDILRRRHGEA